jgi:hypothetical protein
MHIMLDLETMSLAPNAALVSIGAVLMTPRGEEINNFYRSISLASSVDAGLHIDPNTVMWWMQQSDRARGALAIQARPLHEVLRDFAQWADVQEPSGGLVGVWGNGAASDNVWLAEAYRAAGQPRPWSHKQDRCYRTFRAMHRDVADPPPSEAEHDALADARWQARYMKTVCAAKGITLA